MTDDRDDLDFEPDAGTVMVASFVTPLASNPESVGYATSASTTVVSARTRVTLSTLRRGGLGQQRLIQPRRPQPARSGW